MSVKSRIEPNRKRCVAKRFAGSCVIPNGKEQRRAKFGELGKVVKVARETALPPTCPWRRVRFVFARGSGTVSKSPEFQGSGDRGVVRLHQTWPAPHRHSVNANLGDTEKPCFLSAYTFLPVLPCSVGEPGLPPGQPIGFPRFAAAAEESTTRAGHRGVTARIQYPDPRRPRVSLAREFGPHS